MKILILEDNQERIDAFKKKFKEHVLTVVEHAHECIRELKGNSFDQIFLDHDLGGTSINFDPEDCGTLVAEYLEKNPIETPIIIHSFNVTASYRMMQILRGHNVSYAPGIWL